MTLDKLGRIAAGAFAASHGSTERDWWNHAVLAVLREVGRECVPPEKSLSRAPIFDAALGFYGGWNRCREETLKRIHEMAERGKDE